MDSNTNNHRFTYTFASSNKQGDMLPSNLPCYGPHDSIQDALTYIINTYGGVDKVPVGLTIGVNLKNGGEIKEYWIKSLQGGSKQFVEKNQSLVWQ